MFLGVVGFLMVVIIVAALIRGKSNPVPLFVMVPVIAALICGFTPVQIFGFVKAGVAKTWSTAVLFIFSIVYFSMMGDMGLFDPMVNWLVKKAGDNIVMVTVATACIAVISHLDGALASTLLITMALPANRSRYIIRMAAASRTVSFSTLLLNSTVSSCRLNTEMAEAKRSAAVVVFMPPAVDPGEPPISMRKIMRKIPESENRVRSVVLKPAVLQVTD